MTLLLVAFLSGALSVLTPCVLPLLPAILASTAEGGRRRPVGIVIGLVAAFTVSLLAFSAVVRALDIPQNSLRWIAATLLIAFGAIMLIPRLGRSFERAASRVGRFGPKGGGDGFWSGLAVGAGLGVVWAPCVGPILGGVAVAASTGTTEGTHVARAIAFAVGMSIPLLVLLLGGRTAGRALRTRIHPKTVQTVAGIIFVVTGTAIVFEADTKVNRFLSETTGVSSTVIADLEAKVLTDRDDAPTFSSAGNGSDLDDLGEAPDFAGIVQWINTPGERPLDMDALRGKVVLIDFWTYSCINCIRTLPYLRSWHDRYSDDGLVIVGVHAPEFEFEKDEGNVRRAVDEYELDYPIALDNEFRTWRLYDNRYWPAKYIVDRNGRVRYTHFGEGEYEQTEAVIRELLALAPTDSDDEPPAPEPNLSRTPETYVGHERAANFVGRSFGGSVGDFVEDEPAVYEQGVDELQPTQWTLAGTWTVEGERSVAGNDAAIVFRYQAADVHLVLGPVRTTTAAKKVTVTDSESGKRTTIPVDAQTLYTLRSSDKQALGTLTITVPPGIAAYAFTFG